MCTPDSYWNETLFLEFNGSACLHTIGLQTSYHNLDTELCQAAFEGYREITDYTCNCSESPYSLLGGTGGMRPSNVLTTLAIVTNVITALILPVIGTWVDSSPYRRQLFYYSSLTAAACTVLGSIMAEGYIWVIGLFFVAFTAIFYETMFLGLAPYLAEVADTDADRGKLAGLRQFASLAAQMLFVILVAGFRLVIHTYISYLSIRSDKTPDNHISTLLITSHLDITYT